MIDLKEHLKALICNVQDSPEKFKYLLQLKSVEVK